MHNVMTGYITKQFALIIITLLPGFATALESDSEQPIEISANAAMVDEDQGKSVYKGDVVITQGTLKVTAEEVEIYTADNEVTQIIALAEDKKLAHYQQQTSDPSSGARNEMVSAEAQKITYLVQEERLHLAGDAKLRQDEDVFTGELLYYDMARGIVNLNSSSNSGRVNMTITPKKSSQ